MNSNRRIRVAVTLADGSTCWIHDDRTAVYHTKDVDRSIASVHVCQRYGFTVRQTLDHSILADLPPPVNRENDITAIVCETLGCKPDCISEFIINGFAIAARTDRRVCLINFYGLNYPPGDERRNDIGHKVMECFVLDSDIDMFSFKWEHGLVRTIYGVLQPFGSLGQFNSKKHPGGISTSFNISDIREIINGPHSSLLLMKDGRVYGQGLECSDRFGPSEPFEQICFANSDTINKIVTDSYHIIYISSAGTCYYSNIQEPALRGRTGGMVPHLISGLKGYFVDNAFILANCIIIQHDKGCLSMMLLAYQLLYNAHGYYSLSEKHTHDQKRPIALPYFNDKYVVNILQLRHHILFVTEDGCAHQSLNIDDYNTDALVIKPVPFFTDNPIIVGSDHTWIPSAISTHNQD